MTTHTERSPADFVIRALRKTTSELEELHVQLALGNAEAKDVFEAFKKDLHNQVEKLKIKLKQTELQQGLLPVTNAIEHLQVQLALGLADTKDAFESQKKYIEASLHELESGLKLLKNKEEARIQLEIEKFKAKLNLLSLSFQLKKLNVSFDLKQRKSEFEKKLNSLRTVLSIRQSEAKNKWQHFRQEIKDAFAQLNQAFIPFD